MMRDPQTGNWLPYPTWLEVPERALSGRLCPPPRAETIDDVEVLADEVTVRRRRR